MAETIRDALLRMISEITGRDARAAVGDGDLIHTYGMDSIQSVRLIAGIEKAFGIVFGRDPRDMEALASIDRLSRWVEQRV